MGIVSVLVIVLLALSFSQESMAQSGCTTVLISLSPCLNFVTGSSSTPSSSCCSRLANIVQSQPLCLCSALGGGASSLGVTVNKTQALALPVACNVQTPPVSRCDGGSGAAAPATSPGAGSTPADDEPAEAPTDTTSWEGSFPAGSATGARSMPTAGGFSSSGSITKTPSHLITVFVLLAALCKLTDFPPFFRAIGSTK